jgi:hypothetical protein
MAGRLNSILKEFAIAVEQVTPQKMGGIAKPIGQQDVNKVSSRMSDLVRKNGYMMHVAVGIVLALFLFCIAVVVYYRNNPNTAVMVMGGNSLQLVLLVGWLRRLWVEKTAVETLLIATEELPPADAAKLLLSFYFKVLKSK